MLPSRVTASLVTALVVATWPAARAQSPPPALSAPVERALGEIEQLATAEAARDRVGGLSIGVLAGGQLIFTGAYGYADSERRLPAARDGIYRIGSITKQFTAVALMQLHERRLLHLSDLAVRFVPELKSMAGEFTGPSPITVLELATMTSGLAREPEDLDTFLKGPVAQWDAVMLAALARTRVAYEPGSRYHYSNIGYALLGAVIGRAAGEPFVSYIQRRVLEPLDMRDTAFELDAADRGRLAKGYAIHDGKVDTETPRREHQGRGYKVPNGGLYSSVADLARFLAFELGEGPAEVLSRATYDEWAGSLHTAGADLGSGYGIGFQVTRRPTLVAMGHAGSVSGYESAAYVDRRSKTGVIVLRNVSGGLVEPTDLCLRALEKIAAASRSD